MDYQNERENIHKYLTDKIYPNHKKLTDIDKQIQLVIVSFLSTEWTNIKYIVNFCIGIDVQWTETPRKADINRNLYFLHRYTPYIERQSEEKPYWRLSLKF